MTPAFKLEIVEPKRSLWSKYAWVFYVLWLVFALYNCYVDGFKEHWVRSVLGPLSFCIIFIGNRFFSNKSNKNFVIVDDSCVTWKFKEMPSIIKILWQDIEWIKFEKDGISFYKSSSFVDTCLDTFIINEEQREKLRHTITMFATNKQIKFVS
jgi:hypothetical protein